MGKKDYDSEKIDLKSFTDKLLAYEGKQLIAARYGRGKLLLQGEIKEIEVHSEKIIVKMRWNAVYRENGKYWENWPSQSKYDIVFNESVAFKHERSGEISVTSKNGYTYRFISDKVCMLEEKSVVCLSV